MPAPQASAMQNLAKLKFSSFAIKLPFQYKEAADKSMQKQAFKENERNVPPPVEVPPLFLPLTTLKLHVDTTKTISADFRTYIDGICSAICSAWSQWQTAATMTGVVINAVTATGGQIVGPPLTPLIMASAPKSSPQELKYSKAIATVIGTAWAQYTATVKVPGLPWYPAFAALPSPVAPPTPNVPVPVVALMQVTAPLAVPALKGQMIAQLGDPKALHQAELFESIADAFNKCHLLWQTSTMVTNVLGSGPVPTFAPPYVPVGPVVGGVGNMTPGGFV